MTMLMSVCLEFVVLNNMQWGDYEMPRVLVLQMMVVNDSNCAVVVVAAVLL